MSPHPILDAPAAVAGAVRRVLVLDAEGYVGGAIVRAAGALGHRLLTGPFAAAAGAHVPNDEQRHDPRESPPSRADVIVVPSLADGDDTGALAARVRAIEELLGDTGASRLVCVSGLEALGPRPAAEGRVFEGAEERPATARGRALLAAKRALLALRNRSGVSLVILRAGDVCGRGREGFLGRYLRVMEGGDDPELLRSFDLRLHLPLHVDDLGAAAALAVDRGDWIYHLTDGSNPTVGEVFATIAAAARWKGIALAAPRRPLDRLPATSPELLCPHHRAERELGFRPSWHLDGVLAALFDERRLAAQAPGAPSLRREDFAQAAADPLAAEARFWDAEDEAEDLLYLQPHDWAFDPQLGDRMQAPVYRFLAKVFGRERPRLVLDLGCGSGVYSRFLARHGGIRGIGVDLSARKIEKARRLAEEAGVAHLLDYQVADALAFEAPQKVDALCAFGALHHLPDLERHLPGIVARNLEPGGLLVAVEPSEAGYHPLILRFMRWLEVSRFRRCFDVERYHEVASEAAQGITLRGESPAGRVFHRDDFSLDAYLRSASFAPVLVRRTHALAPFFANAFVIYQRSAAVRRLARALVPAVLALDGALSRLPSLRPYAALGLYAVRPRFGAAAGGR